AVCRGGGVGAGGGGGLFGGGAAGGEAEHERGAQQDGKQFLHFHFLLFKIRLSDAPVAEPCAQRACALEALHHDDDDGAHGEHDGGVVAGVAVVDGDGAEAAAAGDAGHGGVAEDGGGGDGGAVYEAGQGLGEDDLADDLPDARAHG